MGLEKALEDRAPSTKEQYIKKLTPRHYEILRMKLAGEKNVQIAKTFSMTRERISYICSSPVFQEEMERSLKKINKTFEDNMALGPIKKKFQDASHNAADKLIELVGSTKASPGLQRNAANDVLDYAGHKKKEAEDHSTKIYIDASIGESIKVAVKDLSIGADLLEETGINLEEIDIVEVETSPSKSEGSGGAG